MRWCWYSITGLLRQQHHLSAHLSACNINLNCVHQLKNYSSDRAKGNLHIWYQNGLPVLKIPLPSKKEMCQFTLKPVSDTVARFCKNIECEDKGIEIVYVYSTSGNRIAGSTSVEHLLLQGNFKLRINDLLFTVEVPPLRDTDSGIGTDGDTLQKFDDLRSAVASLYAIMNVEEYKAFRERILLEEYENVQAELKPLVQIKAEIDAFCKRRAQRILWLTLGAMGFQAGFLARLTWWEYSWDTMEPITYFATYATLIASFAYYLYTNQYYNYNDHKRRAMSLYFHKQAARSNFDISRFNELQNIASSLRHDLKRLQDPLYQHLPATRLASLLRESKRMRPTSSTKEQS